MIEFLGILPKLIVTVGIVYFAINPWVRQQMTINVVNLVLIVLMLLTISCYFDVMNYLELAIVLGLLFLLALLTRGILRWKDRDCYLLINVFPKNYEVLKRFFHESAIANNFAFEKLCYSSKIPFLVIFKTNNHKQVLKIVKDTEKFIHDHIPISFWHCYAWMIFAAIVIAIIWRF
ncbi:MAG: hypothetical protein WC479_03485 [Candidatus Izemoplasmatales bacterium]|jgi:hypothetical protein|nr:hypothetical protein [Candidatus Izemoplasmatales bacterium]MDD3864796.1 hypothetical protein [Candidatus Izemoplasmatales bacterium]